MPVQFTIMRAILGVLAVGFAYQLGRHALMVYRGAKVSQVVSWGFRTAAALIGALWLSRSDRLAVGVTVLSAIAAGLGVYVESRPKREEEDLSKLIFPKE